MNDDIVLVPSTSLDMCTAESRRLRNILRCLRWGMLLTGLVMIWTSVASGWLGALCVPVLLVLEALATEYKARAVSAEAAVIEAAFGIRKTIDIYAEREHRVVWEIR